MARNKKSDQSSIHIIQPPKGSKENPTKVNVNVGVFGVTVSNTNDRIPKCTLSMKIDGQVLSYPPASVDRDPVTPHLFLVKFQLPITVPDQIKMVMHAEDSNPKTAKSDDAYYIQQESGYGGPIQIKTPAPGALVNVNANPFGVVVVDQNNSTVDGTLTINGNVYQCSSVVQLTQSAPYQWLVKFSLSITVASGTPITCDAEDTAGGHTTACYTQM